MGTAEVRFWRNSAFGILLLLTALCSITYFEIATPEPNPDRRRLPSECFPAENDCKEYKLTRTGIDDIAGIYCVSDCDSKGNSIRVQVRYFFPEPKIRRRDTTIVTQKEIV